MLEKSEVGPMLPVGVVCGVGAAERLTGIPPLTASEKEIFTKLMPGTASMSAVLGGVAVGFLSRRFPIGWLKA